MDFKTVSIDSFTLMGTSTKMKIENTNEGIANFWSEIVNNNALNQIHEIKTDGPHFDGRVVAVWQKSAGNDNEVIYSVGMEFHPGSSVYALEAITVPAKRWAIFKFVGKIPERMIEAKEEVFNAFIPNSNDLFSDSLYLEVYSNNDKKSNYYPFELWIALD